MTIYSKDGITIDIEEEGKNTGAQVCRINGEWRCMAYFRGESNEFIIEQFLNYLKKFPNGKGHGGK